MTMHATYLSPAALAAQCLRDDPSFALLTPAEQRAETRAVLSQIADVDPDDIDLQMEAMALAAQPVEAAKASTRIVDTGRKKIVVAQPVAAAPVAPEPVQAVKVPAEPERAPEAAPAGWQPQPCRNPAGCTETLAATGRCMQCGAQRKQVGATIARPVIEAPMPAKQKALDPIFRKGPHKRQKPRKDKVRKETLLKRPTSTPEGFARRRAKLAEGGLIERVKAATNAPDHYLARIINRSRPTIQAYLNQRIPYDLDRWQLTQLRDMLQQQYNLLNDTLDEVGALLAVTPE